MDIKGRISLYFKLDYIQLQSVMSSITISTSSSLKKKRDKGERQNEKKERGKEEKKRGEEEKGWKEFRRKERERGE